MLHHWHLVSCASFLCHSVVSAIGDIVLEAGDCLMLVADGEEFETKHRNNSTFALVSKVGHRCSFNACEAAFPQANPHFA